MAQSIRNVKKSSRGRPPVDSEPITLRLPRDMLDALARFSAEQPAPQPSRTEALRIILKDWLVGSGYLPAGQESEANGD